MLIRTANKKMLTEVVSLYIRPSISYEDPNQTFCVAGISTNNQEIVLSPYISEEEAQIILDKIYDHRKMYPTDLVYTIPTTEEIQKMMINEVK